MYLIRLIYASKVSPDFSPEEISDILNKSKSNNADLKVTGALIYSNNYYLQCLEGSRINVNQLYHKILLDKRHNLPSILNYEEISQRDFDQWSMGYIPPSSISGELVLRFSGDTKFNPYSMSGKACYLFLKELKNLDLLR